MSMNLCIRSLRLIGLCPNPEFNASKVFQGEWYFHTALRRRCSVLSDEGVQFWATKVFNDTAVFTRFPWTPRSSLWIILGFPPCCILLSWSNSLIFTRLASSSGLPFLLFPIVKPPLWFTPLYTAPEVYTMFGTDSPALPRILEIHTEIIQLSP